MAKRILALVSEPVSGEALKSAIGKTEAEQAEVLVVAPALDKSYRFWLSDPDPAIERAEEVQEETVERMEEEGIDAAGDTGESDPLLAIQDALATYEADEIVLFTHPDGERGFLEGGIVEEAQERFSRPVRHIEVER
jgi:Universal stress protein family